MIETPKQTAVDRLTRIDELLLQVIELLKEMKEDRSGEMVLEELRKLNKYKELEKRRWERFNPAKDDEPIYDWTAIETAPGEQVTFTYPVPEGFIFHCDRIQINWEDDCTYQIFTDSEWTAQTDEVIQDLGDHVAIFRPPKKIRAQVEVVVVNNSINNIIFVPFFGGFIRKIKRPGYKKEESEIDIEEEE